MWQLRELLRHVTFAPMKISIVAAMGHGRVIGSENQMPWHLPADLKHFKAVTMGKPVVMGRKTYESIGKPLPGRRNVVVSRQQDLKIPGCDVVMSFDAILDLLHKQPEVMVIGGGSIYEQAMLRASRMYLTFIDTNVKGVTFFPN